uniref:Abnormal spindle-like microcephaly-assoc'd, ASPM-SPD-2-Hydin n=1 Tax=Candidatus Kentrum sp. DK TaxID=2126562 RepID=A0A450T6A3_9GAMM|nr:MAG: hypothetical protein BECKDK2373C_GA0170839_10967 [Candidatus Kentron sp. DK]
MATIRYYRCENEYGADPCEYAKENRRIPESEVSPPMDDSTPKCPGKTVSGVPCGQPLVAIAGGGNKFPLPIIGGVASGMVLIGLLIFFLFNVSGTPQIAVSPASLVIPKAGGGAPASASITISNPGDGELVIDKIQANPATFSAAPISLKVEAAGAATLTVRFDSPSTDMTEGILILRHNAANAPARIPLVANRNPWWVYRRLEQSSTILQ